MRAAGKGADPTSDWFASLPIPVGSAAGMDITSHETVFATEIHLLEPLSPPLQASTK